jgi:hypothetical protein
VPPPAAPAPGVSCAIGVLLAATRYQGVAVEKVKRGRAAPWPVPWTLIWTLPLMSRVPGSWLTMLLSSGAVAGSGAGPRTQGGADVIANAATGGSDAVTKSQAHDFWQGPDVQGCSCVNGIVERFRRNVNPLLLGNCL